MKPNKEILEKLKEPEKYAPSDCYCYSKDGLCPFYERNPDKEYQLNGYCHYLEKGDWMDQKDGGTFLLWDLVKECNLNIDPLFEDYSSED